MRGGHLAQHAHDEQHDETRERVAHDDRRPDGRDCRARCRRTSPAPMMPPMEIIVTCRERRLCRQLGNGDVSSVATSLQIIFMSR